MAVREVMTRDPVAVAPDTPVLDAIRRMWEHEASCLPVVQDDQLVGILSERDVLPLAAELLEASRPESGATPRPRTRRRDAPD